MADMNVANPIYDFVITHDDSVQFYKELDLVMEHLYDTKTTLEDVLSDHLSHEKKQAVLTFAQNEKMSISKPEEMQQVLDKLKASLAHVPVVEMRVAFEPSERLLFQITKWLNEDKKQRVFVRFVIDRELIAGAVISYNGMIHDYSIKTQIEQLLSTQT